MMILALGLVTLATASSFAAVPFFTTSTTNIIPVNAQTGLAGSVLYTPLATGTVTAGEIINIAYQAPISFLLDFVVNVSYTNAGTTRTEAFTGFTAYGVTQTSASSGISVTVNQQSVFISFSSAINFTPTDYIKIDGVRLDVSSMATAGGLTTVSLSNTTGQATALNSTLTVGTFADALATPTVTGITASNFLNFYSSFARGTGLGSNGAVPYNGAPQNLVTVTLAELFPNAFEARGATWNGTQIAMSFSNIPAGLTISGVTLAPSATPSGGTALAVTTTAALMSSTSFGNAITLMVTGSAKNAMENVAVGITFSVTSGTTTLAVNPSPISVTATLGPVAPTIPTGYPGAGGPDYPFSANPPLGYTTTFGAANWYYTNGSLKYTSRPTTAATIPVVITPLTTNLLSPFNMAIRDAAHAGEFIYDTGISISNTSGTAGSLTGAPAQLAGTIKISLYPLDGSGPKTFTPGSDSATRPGLGLSSSGTLATGQTWVVMLSQLLTPAGFSSTADFRGFIRFQCAFQGAIGIAYIADGDFSTTGTSQGYVMLSDVPVVASPSGGLF